MKENILEILKKLKNLLTSTKQNEPSGIIKTQPITPITTDKKPMSAEILFEVYSDEALIQAIEADMIDQVCSAASLDFQMIKEDYYGENKAYA